MCGTYIKVRNTEPVALNEGQHFLVGPDIIIDIEKVENDPLPSSVPSEDLSEEMN